MNILFKLIFIDSIGVIFNQHIFIDSSEFILNQLETLNLFNFSFKNNIPAIDFLNQNFQPYY